MRKLNTILAASIVACLCILNLNAQTPQNPSWSQPPDLINYNSGAPAISAANIPISNFAHNVAQDLNGNVLFYVVDGNIYDASGTMISSVMWNYSGQSGDVTGITEYLIVPVPGNCSQYYLIAGAYTNSNLSTGGYPLPFYIKLDLSVGGGTLYNAAGSSTTVADLLVQYQNSDQHSGALHFAVSPLRYTNDRLLFVANTMNIYRYKITGTGIFYDNYNFDYTNYGTTGSGQMRSEMELFSKPGIPSLVQNAVNYKLALPYSSSIANTSSRILVTELDFSGTVVNTPKTIDFPVAAGALIKNEPKGIEFSTDGNTLYINNTHAPYVGYSDLTAANLSLSTLTGVTNAVDFGYSQIEWAYDGKLYMCASGASPHLASISNPLTPATPGWQNPATIAGTFTAPFTLSTGNFAGTNREIILMTDQMDGEEYGVIIPPTSIPIAGNTICCTGTTTTLSAPSGYTLYQWSTGATTQSITVSTSGTYTVTVANASGCVGKSSINVNVINCCYGTHTLTGIFKASDLISGGYPFMNGKTMTSGFTGIGGVNNTVALNGTINIDDPDFTFDNLELILGPGSKITDYHFNITLNNPVKFTGYNYFHSCGSEMWQGFDFRMFSIEAYTGTTWIEDAEIALKIYSDYTDFHLANVHFNKNWRNIENHTVYLGNAGNIHDCEFTCKNLTSGLPDVCITPQLGKISYSAVEIYNDGDMNIGNANNGMNYFDNLQNGILNWGDYGGTLTVKNNKFSNINYAPGSGNISGYCIYGDAAANIAGQNFVIGGTGLNEFNIFENSRNGILGKLNVNMDIQLNRFTNLSGNDIANVSSSGVTIYIYNNIFNGFYRGVYLGDVTGGSNVTIRLNSFNMNSTLAGTYCIDFRNVIKPPVANTTHVSQNSFWKIDRTAVYLINYDQCIIDNTNTITFEPAVPVLGSAAKYGVRMQNSWKTIISENIIQRTGADPTSTNYNITRYGISSERSNYNTLSCNQIIKLGTAIRYINSLQPNTNHSNELIHNRIGFSLESANIWTQGAPTLAQKNKWDDMAAGLFDWDISGSGQPYAVDWYTHSASSQWQPLPAYVNYPSNFLAGSLPVNPLCIVPCPTCRQRALAAIANEEGDFNLLSDDEQYMAKREVFTALTDDNSLMYLGTDDDQTLQNFYTVMGQESMGQLADVNEMINQDLGVADAMNSTVQPDNHFEENETIVNEIYIRLTEEAREELTTAEYDLLYNIAMENPLTGGNAVYSARVMLDIDLDDNIETAGGRMANEPRKVLSLFNKKAEAIKTISCNLTPNPASESVNYTTTLEKGSTGAIEIKNTFGKNIITANLYEGENTVAISLKAIESGIYFYSININGKQTENGKLVIVH